MIDSARRLFEGTVSTDVLDKVTRILDEELSPHSQAATRTGGRGLEFGSSTSDGCPDLYIPSVHVITDEIYNEATQFSNTFGVEPFWQAWRAGAGAAAGNGAQDLMTIRSGSSATGATE